MFVPPRQFLVEVDKFGVDAREEYGLTHLVCDM